MGLPAALYANESARKANRPHVTMDEKTARLLQQCAWEAVQEVRKLQKEAATRPAATKPAATKPGATKPGATKPGD